ncbi:MAG: hypothetical protein NC299_00770 [Lachnospiraceae bacterium]|nr:hypothetical protein [Ruminococcus sp.]MCM1273880.1 hypothetical protein [Lachnospiraceae bacterium]
MKFAAVLVADFPNNGAEYRGGAAEKGERGMKFAAAPTVVFTITEPKTRSAKV